MRINKWIPVLIAGSVIAACFFPWVTIARAQINIGGFTSDISDYGKPGLLHVILSSLYILLILIGRPWSVRTAFFLAALNVAWALRNYMLISSCRGGECPEKHLAFYMVGTGSLLMMAAIFFMNPAQRRLPDEKS